MFLLMNISPAEPGGVPGSLMLAKDGKTEYRVVIPKGFHPEVKAAADDARVAGVIAAREQPEPDFGRSTDRAGVT